MKKKEIVEVTHVTEHGENYKEINFSFGDFWFCVTIFDEEKPYACIETNNGLELYFTLKGEETILRLYDDYHEHLPKLTISQYNQMYETWKAVQILHNTNQI